MRQLAGAQHIRRDAGIPREILIDELLRGATLDAELRRQSERAHAVDQSEVHRLDVPALVRRDLADRHAEDLGRRRFVNVLSFGERFLQRRIAGQMGHDPQLDLRIVRRNEHVPR